MKKKREKCIKRRIIRYGKEKKREKIFMEEKNYMRKRKEKEKKKIFKEKTNNYIRKRKLKYKRRNYLQKGIIRTVKKRENKRKHK